MIHIKLTVKSYVTSIHTHTQYIYIYIHIFIYLFISQLPHVLLTEVAWLMAPEVTDVAPETLTARHRVMGWEDFDHQHWELNPGGSM